MQSNTAAFFEAICGSQMPTITFISRPNRDARGSIVPSVHDRIRPKRMYMGHLLRHAAKGSTELFFAPVPMGGDGMPSEAMAKEAAVIWADVDQEFTAEQWALIERLDATVNESGGVGRHHVFVPLDVPHAPHVIKELNQALRVALDGDSKQSPASFLRVPGTYNRKGDPVLCRTVRLSSSRQTLPSVRQALRTGGESVSAQSRVGGERETPTGALSALTLPEIPEGFNWLDNKPGYARMRKCLREWNGRFADGRNIQRHKATMAIVKDAIRYGLTVDEAYAFAARCEPLVDKQEEENGYSIHKDVARTWRREAASTTPSSAVAEAAHTEGAGVRDEPALSANADDVAADADDGPEKFRRLDWAASFVKDFTEVDWLPGRFVERGQQVSLVADGKVGKSLFVLNWCMALALEWRFLGHTTGEAYRVLYFDRENSERDIITRARSLGLKTEHLAALGERFDYRQFPQFDGTLDNPAAEAARQFLAIVDETKPDVVIIDTASRFIGGKEDSSDTWLQLYQLIHEPLKARGIACIRLDHFGKDEGRGSRGSSAKSQDVDHVWEMTRKSAAEVGSSVVTTLAMKRTHTRTGYGDDLLSVVRVGVKTARGLWEDGGTSHKLQTQEEVNQAVVHEGLTRPDRIAEILRRSGPLSPTELVAAHFPELTKRTVQRDLTELAEQGRIQNVGRSNAPSWVAL